MKRLIFLLAAAAVVLSLGVSAFAQRPRVSDPQPTTNEKPTTTQEQKKDDPNQAKTTTAQDDSSPQTTTPVQNVKVKYEGGVFGYRQKMDGFLYFEDVNSRLVFKDKQQKEIFSIPYEAISSAFADTQSRRPTAATVIGSAVPYGLGLPALLFKKKYRYLTMQYNDSEVAVSGVTSFKVGSKELLEQTLKTLADKAKLTPRGEIYIKRRTTTKTSTATIPFGENR